MAGSTEVYILGQRYTIRGDTPEEHIRELARFIDGKINDVYGRHPNINSTQALILALFNIAEELHDIRSAQEDLTKDIEEKAARLAGLFD